MNRKLIFLFIISTLITVAGFSQEKSKKELKAEKKIEEQRRVEALINSNNFVFEARTALPTGMRPIDLSTRSNYVTFEPEMIDSYMPFFGKAYSGAGFGNDNGLEFKGKPEEFTLEKGKKNYQINTLVKGESDSYRISLSVSFSGYASLSISSNKRSTISYQGEISEIKKEEGKN